MKIVTILVGGVGIKDNSAVLKCLNTEIQIDHDTQAERLADFLCSHVPFDTLRKAIAIMKQDRDAAELFE